MFRGVSLAPKQRERPDPLALPPDLVHSIIGVSAQRPPDYGSTADVGVSAASPLLATSGNTASYQQQPPPQRPSSFFRRLFCFARQSYQPTMSRQVPVFDINGRLTTSQTGVNMFRFRSLSFFYFFRSQPWTALITYSIMFYLLIVFAIAVAYYIWGLACGAGMNWTMAIYFTVVSLAANGGYLGEDVDTMTDSTHVCYRGRTIIVMVCSYVNIVFVGLVAALVVGKAEYTGKLGHRVVFSDFCTLTSIPGRPGQYRLTFRMANVDNNIPLAHGQLRLFCVTAEPLKEYRYRQKQMQLLKNSAPVRGLAKASWGSTQQLLPVGEGGGGSGSGSRNLQTQPLTAAMLEGRRATHRTQSSPYQAAGPRPPLDAAYLVSRPTPSPHDTQSPSPPRGTAAATAATTTTTLTDQKDMAARARVAQLQPPPQRRHGGKSHRKRKNQVRPAMRPGGNSSSGADTLLAAQPSLTRGRRVTRKGEKGDTHEASTPGDGADVSTSSSASKSAKSSPQSSRASSRSGSRSSSATSTASSAESLAHRQATTVTNSKSEIPPTRTATTGAPESAMHRDVGSDVTNSSATSQANSELYAASPNRIGSDAYANVGAVGPGEAKRLPSPAAVAAAAAVVKPNPTVYVPDDRESADDHEPERVHLRVQEMRWTCAEESYLDHGDSGQLSLWYPATIIHTIDERSPLHPFLHLPYVAASLKDGPLQAGVFGGSGGGNVRSSDDSGVAPPSLASRTETTHHRFQLVAVFDATEMETGSTITAKHTYTTVDIVAHYKFSDRLVHMQAESSEVLLDFHYFNALLPVDLVELSTTDSEL